MTGSAHTPRWEIERHDEFVEVRAIESPLEPIFAGARSPVPGVFRAQFLHSVDDPARIVLEGTLEQVWHRPRWLKPLFQFLGRMRILVPDTGERIPTTLEVGTGRLADGRPYHCWIRRMYFSTVRYFPTTIVYDAEWKSVVDLVGPRNALHMVWRARFRPPDTFTLDTQACGVYLLGRVRWLPDSIWPWLVGRVRFRQRAPEPHGKLTEIELIIGHPLFGDVFGYHGRFEVHRYENET